MTCDKMGYYCVYNLLSTEYPYPGQDNEQVYKEQKEQLSQPAITGSNFFRWRTFSKLHLSFSCRKRTDLSVIVDWVKQECKVIETDEKKNGSNESKEKEFNIFSIQNEIQIIRLWTSLCSFCLSCLVCLSASSIVSFSIA